MRLASRPKFLELDPEVIEDLCCALLAHEPGVNRADLYRMRYAAQSGIDAFGDTADGLIVASCKWCGQIRNGETAAWSEDFVKHWKRNGSAVCKALHSRGHRQRQLQGPSGGYRPRACPIRRSRCLLKGLRAAPDTATPPTPTGIVSQYLGRRIVLSASQRRRSGGPEPSTGRYWPG